MRIGMILDNSFPPDPRVENEALTLIEGGHQVFLFCFDYSHHQLKHEIINGINIYREKISKSTHKLSALAYTFPFYHFLLHKAIKAFALENKIEIFHIHDIQIARSVFRVNRKLNIPIVLDLHENRPEIMKYYAHVNSLLGKLLISPKKWKINEFKYIQFADKIIVVTKEAKNYYLNHIPVNEKKIHVVPNSIRKAFYSDYNVTQEIIDKYKDNYTILYLGETGLRRGLETAILSLKHVIPQIPNIKLVIVGKSKTDAILKNKAKELGYENYVDFEGWQDFNLFPSYILSSDVGICPIHRNIHHDTTYANKIFQQLSFGKPLIVSDCKAQAELVKNYNCGLVFKDRDPEDLANNILTLFHNKDMYAKFSKNGKIAVENSLNWNVLSKELLKLYCEI